MSYKVDPIETDPKYQKQIKKAEKKAESKCKDKKGKLGYCHAFWGAKKQILFDEFGIEWKSPAELNPYWKFD